MLRALPVLTVALLVAALTASSRPATRTTATRVPRFGHVFLIIGENTSYEQLTATRTPYLVGTLRPRSAWLTGYRALPRTKSLGEYIAMTSGQFNRCEARDDLPQGCHQAVDNVFHQLAARGHSWKAYLESMINPCDVVDHGTTWSGNKYAAHHNPVLYYNDLEGRRYGDSVRPAAPCATRDLPMGTTLAPGDTSALDAALAAGSVGDLTLIVADDCENGHNLCAGHKDPVRAFDGFLAREVPKIETSPAFGADAAIVITWDEGGDPPHQPEHVVTVVAGPLVAPGTSSARYDHYSLLRTLEDGFGLPALRHARTAKPFAGIWK